MNWGVAPVTGPSSCHDHPKAHAHDDKFGVRDALEQAEENAQKAKVGSVFCSKGKGVFR